MPIITKTQICNMALGFIGEAELADFDGDTDRKARYCRLYYPQAYSEVLEDLEWTFATKHVELTEESVDEPLFGFAYAFELPSDFIAVVQVDPVGIEWRIEGTLLLTDYTPFGMVYTYDLTNTAQFSAKFVACLSMLLASKLAMPLTRKPEYMRLGLEAYGMALANARHQDSKQSSRTSLAPDTLLQVRYDA